MNYLNTVFWVEMLRIHSKWWFFNLESKITKPAWFLFDCTACV